MSCVCLVMFPDYVKGQSAVLACIWAACIKRSTVHNPSRTTYYRYKKKQRRGLLAQMTTSAKTAAVIAAVIIATQCALASAGTW